MSTVFLVYQDENERPHITEDFADAMWEFLRGVVNGDPVEMKYSP